MAETPTPRELTCLQATVEQGGYAKAAAVLPISPATVRSHVREAMSKLGGHTYAQAFAIAVRRGLIDVQKSSVD